MKTKRAFNDKKIKEIVYKEYFVVELVTVVTQ
jgi:hypothetical protein